MSATVGDVQEVVVGDDGLRPLRHKIEAVLGAAASVSPAIPRGSDRSAAFMEWWPSQGRDP